MMAAAVPVADLPHDTEKTSEQCVEEEYTVRVVMDRHIRTFAVVAVLPMFDSRYCYATDTIERCMWHHGQDCHGPPRAQVHDGGSGAHV